MKIAGLFQDNRQAELDAPPIPGAGLFKAIFAVYLASFVFDYKSANLDFGAPSTGGSPAQYLFLMLALASGAAGTFFGARHLLTKPGVFLVVYWWAYVFFSIAVAFLSGNEAGRILRLLIPSLLVGLGINLTVICACVGMRPGQAVRWFLFAGMANVIWCFVHGAFFSGVPLSEVRMGILSPAMRFLFAWSGCALLLRHKFSPWILVVFSLPLAVAIISITRSLALPIAISFVAAAFCLGLGLLWKMYDWSHALRKIIMSAVFGAVAILAIAAAIVALPEVAQRWEQRLFDNKGQGGATTEDLSSLMRKAEATSMWRLLAKDPYTFVYGKGLGASYYWDEDYYPELFLVYPKDRHQFPLDIYSAGHSVWTYTLFSTGFVGVFVVASSFFIAMGLSLHSARLNARTVMGPRAWDSFLIFFPFVGMWATLSESITRNPFDDRFTGVLFGFLIALPQFYYNRAYFLSHRERLAQNSAQVIFNGEFLSEHDEMESSPKLPPSPLYRPPVPRPASSTPLPR